MRVLCDVDGVLAEWKPLFKKYLAEVGFEIEGIGWLSTQISATKAQIEYAWLKMSQPGVATTLPTCPGAIQGLKRILEIAEVYFVTAQVERSSTWCYDRTTWLKMHFGEEQGQKVVFTHHKYLCEGDVLIDDKEYNIAAWKQAHPDGLAILWDHPHNAGQETVGIRCGNWDDLYELLRRKSQMVKIEADDLLSWEERYRKLESLHLEETRNLLTQIEEVKQHSFRP